MSIIISKEGKNSELLSQSEFENEDYLQSYIYNNPESIPVYEIQENKRLFVAKREFRTNSGPIDALAIDKDGEIYIIETKLFRNPDKRIVIAQALDYGAALWKHLTDFSEFIRILDHESREKFNMDFQDKIQAFFGLAGEQVEMLLDRLRRNLNDGCIKFIILMDSIDERLKDLIIYVNQNSQFDIYAVQFKYYKFNEYEVVIPKLFGAEVKKNVKNKTKKKVWDENLFFQALGVNADDGIHIAKNILSWSDSQGLIIKWGSGRSIGTFYPVFAKNGMEQNLFGVLSSGKIEIVFQGYPAEIPDLRSDLFQRLNLIAGVSFLEERAETWDSFDIRALKDDKARGLFFETFEWVIEQIKAYE